MLLICSSLQNLWIGLRNALSAVRVIDKDNTQTANMLKRLATLFGDNDNPTCLREAIVSTAKSSACVRVSCSPPAPRPPSLHVLTPFPLP